MSKLRVGVRQGIRRLREGDTAIIRDARKLDALYRACLSASGSELRAIDAKIAELERSIAAQPARGLPDAAVQLMIAAAHIEYLRCSSNDAEPWILKQSEAVLRSALAWVIERGQLDLRGLGAEWYIPPPHRPGHQRPTLVKPLGPKVQGPAGSSRSRRPVPGGPRRA